MVMPDPVLIQLVGKEHSDPNLPDTGENGQSVDVYPGPVCVEVLQV